MFIFIGPEQVIMASNYNLSYDYFIAIFLIFFLLMIVNSDQFIYSQVASLVTGQTRMETTFLTGGKTMEWI